MGSPELRGRNPTGLVCRSCLSTSGECSGPNRYILKKVSVGAATLGNDASLICSTTELDSHANMAVLGKQINIIQDLGLCAEVNAFPDEISKMSQVPIVDGCMAYDYPATGKTFILVVRNGLYIPTMENGTQSHAAFHNARGWIGGR